MRLRTIEIDGTTYSVRFTFNLMAELEERLGFGASQLFMRDMSFAGARLLLFYGLRTKHKSITLDRAGELVGAYCEKGGKLADLIQFLFDTMKHCGVVAEDKPEKPEGEGEGGDETENPPVRLVPSVN